MSFSRVDIVFCEATAVYVLIELYNYKGTRLSPSTDSQLPCIGPRVPHSVTDMILMIFLTPLFSHVA